MLPRGSVQLSGSSDRDIYFIPNPIQGVGVLGDDPSRAVIGKPCQPISVVIIEGGICAIRVMNARQVPFVIVLVVMVIDDACRSHCPPDLSYYLTDLTTFPIPCPPIIYPLVECCGLPPVRSFFSCECPQAILRTSINLRFRSWQV